MAAVEREIGAPLAMPAPLARKVEDSFRHGGATRLRESRGFSEWKWLYSGLAVAAATIIAVLFVVPAIRKPDATVSASEILAKSASQLSATITSGIEVLEYELVLDGVPKEMLPDQVDGTYRVWQAIDHNVPGRFRFASYTADGRMLTSIAEDPLEEAAESPRSPPRDSHSGSTSRCRPAPATCRCPRWSGCTCRRRSR